jgi:uncharacterized protein (TIGR02996 family)
MSDGEGLLRAVLAATRDDAPRLVLADWCDENGRPRAAELFRAWVGDRRREMIHVPVELDGRPFDRFPGWLTGATLADCATLTIDYGSEKQDGTRAILPPDVWDGLGDDWPWVFGWPGMPGLTVRLFANADSAIGALYRAVFMVDMPEPACAPSAAPAQV